MEFEERISKSLLKSRAKAMYSVLISKLPYEKGNLRIALENNVFYYFFRSDRPFLMFDLVTGKCQDVDCGEFEGTKSLIQQRKEMYKAIREFKEKVLPLIHSDHKPS